MIGWTLKPFRMPAILGLAPGVVVALAIGLVSAGVFGALMLDRMTRGSGSAEASRQATGTAVEAVFVAPDESIARVLPGNPDHPWLRHAAAFDDADMRPRLAIVVVDDGSDASASLNAMRLTAPVTMAIAPSAKAADERAAAARRFGREILLLLPMASETRFDTAPNPIAIHVSRDELLRRVRWNLAQLDDYVGVMNAAGETTSRDPETMRAVLEVLGSAGLSFVDARSHEDSVAGAVARRLGVPAGDRNVAVPRAATVETLSASMAVAVQHAERFGSAIVTLPAERRTVKALRQWLATPPKGVALAPVTAVIKRLRSGRAASL